MVKDTIEQYSNDLAEFTKKKEEAVAQLKKNFFSLLEPFFTANPTLESIGWHQDYPWMDGAQSEFRADFDPLILNEEEENEDFPYELEENIKKVLKSIPEALYEDIFGAYITVTVKKDGSLSKEAYYSY